MIGIIRVPEPVRANITRASFGKGLEDCGQRVRAAEVERREGTAYLTIGRRCMTVKRPSPGALLLGLIPFLAMCFSVSLWDRVDPMILGVPFNLFWLLAWIPLTSACMWAAYRLEAPRNPEMPPHHQDRGRAQ
jgi:hypothetical protein